MVLILHKLFYEGGGGKGNILQIILQSQYNPDLKKGKEVANQYSSWT